MRSLIATDRPFSMTRELHKKFLLCATPKVQAKFQEIDIKGLIFRTNIWSQEWAVFNSARPAIQFSGGWGMG